MLFGLAFWGWIISHCHLHSQPVTSQWKKSHCHIKSEMEVILRASLVFQSNERGLTHRTHRNTNFRKSLHSQLSNMAMFLQYTIPQKTQHLGRHTVESFLPDYVDPLNDEKKDNKPRSTFPNNRVNLSFHPTRIVMARKDSTPFYWYLFLWHALGEILGPQPFISILYDSRGCCQLRPPSLHQAVV